MSFVLFNDRGEVCGVFSWPCQNKQHTIQNKSQRDALKMLQGKGIDSNC